MLAVFVAGATAEAQAVGPRPLRMADLTPGNVFYVLSEFAQMGDQSGLVFPVGIDLRLAEEIAFSAEFPFGYANTSGTVAQPVIGNLLLGARGSKHVPMGATSAFRYGMALTGRIPTTPGLGLEAAAGRASLLRSVSYYDSERWTPASGAIRVDLGLAFDVDPFAAALELGGTGVLPIDDRPAALGLHYGLMLAARTLKAVWAVVELNGADIAPGLPDEPRGHYLALALGVRLELGRFSPAVHVAFPLYGEAGERRPLVFSLELASF